MMNSAHLTNWVIIKAYHVLNLVEGDAEALDEVSPDTSHILKFFL